ncbi:MAG: energy transducer TonB [Desulfohalobiaceae bacterium]|nr:energy transducer TonB [Desulfohalobiaceae bacterium]
MRPSLRDSSIAVICAVLINAVIFLSIPFLNTVREQEAKKSYMGTPVTVSYQAEKSANKPEDSEPDQKPEPEQSVQPKPSPRPPDLSERQPEAPETRSDLDLPEPSFELPEADIGSVAISAPETRAPKQPSSGPEAVSLRQVDRKPRVLSRVEPVYPRRARQRDITGKVVLKFLVGKDGTVKRISVVSADPGGVFEDSAISAVKKWRFEPGRVDGEPVPTWVRLPVSFTLSD